MENDDVCVRECSCSCDVCSDTAETVLIDYDDLTPSQQEERDKFITLFSKKDIYNDEITEYQPSLVSSSSAESVVEVIELDD